MKGGVKLLAIAIIALVIASFSLAMMFLIQSTTSDTLGRLNAIVDTLPGAYDVKRLLGDIEKTGMVRATVVCDEPKNTHIAWTPCSPEKPPLAKQLKKLFWGPIRSLANHFLSEVYIPVEKSSEIKDLETKRWEIKRCCITGEELDRFLAEGWEPFSVTSNDEVWLRGEVKAEEEKKH